MGLSSRLLRVFKSYLPYRKVKSFINYLTKPISPHDFLDEEDVNEVLQRGISRTDEYMAMFFYLRYAKNKKEYRDKNFSLDQLFEMADIIGVPREFARIDLKNWIRNQHRRKLFKENLKAFIIFQSFIMTLGIAIGSTITGIIYVALAWGIALLILFLNIREFEAEETARAFHKWIEFKKIENELETFQSSSDE